MKKSHLLINRILLLIILVFIGCSASRSYAQESNKSFNYIANNEQVEQGQELINDTYNLVAKNYVDPVHPYRLMIGAVKGIESIVGKTNLLLEGTGADVVVSPITKKPYQSSISDEEARHAIIEIFQYVVSNNLNYSPMEIASTALNKMVQSLDPHSSLLLPDEVNALKVGTQGKFTGIGISITMRNEFVTVIAPIEGTPAYKAGIRRGDKIIRVDSKPVKNLLQSVKMMRGPKGTSVVVTIMRDTVKGMIDFHLVRDVIPIESVKYLTLKPGYGYIWITRFSESTPNDFIQALEELERSDVPLKGLVFDLRDNPGGLLNQALKVPDVFLEKGKILTIKGRDERNTMDFKVKSKYTGRNYPIVLLINGGSASASEIVAGALQDHNRALILGTTSFGKGSVQTFETLRSGYGLKLTIARYYTPSGRAIQAKGIVPDVILKDTRIGSTDEFVREKDLKNHLDPKPVDSEKDKTKPLMEDYRHGPITLNRLLSDNQIKRAFEILKRSYFSSIPEMKAISREISPPVQHKPAIHVAYPKGGEQIADERVTLLGYVTSTNKTKSLKLFVNRKRQFVDELWRVSPIETIGLRGYPLDFVVPIETGKNIIEIRVLDQEGFMVNHVIEVNRIEIAETRVASSVSLGKRLPDLESKTQNKQVNENNFAVVIEDWVKQTAVSDYNKGNRMYDAGRLERAAYYYRKAVQTNPLTPAFFNLGLALKGIGNEHDARQAFVKACEQKEERACDMISQ